MCFGMGCKRTRAWEPLFKLRILPVMITVIVSMGPGWKTCFFIGEAYLFYFLFNVLCDSEHHNKIVIDHLFNNLLFILTLQ